MRQNLFRLIPVRRSGGQAGDPGNAAATVRRQLSPVHTRNRVKIQMQRILEIDLHALLLRKIPPTFVFRGQIPLLQERPDGGRRGLHAEIHHQPFGAQIDGGNDPVVTGPVEFLSDAQLTAGPPAGGTAPKIAVIIDFPRRGPARCVRIQLQVIVFLRIAEFSGIERALQIPEIPPRVLHGREAGPPGDPVQGRFLLLRARCIRQKRLKLLRRPLPGLLEGGAVAAGKQQAQKVGKILRHGMDIVRRGIHGADGEHHLAKAADPAEMNAVHTGPANDPGPLRRAEIGLVFVSPLQPQRGQIDAIREEFRTGQFHLCLLPLFRLPGRRRIPLRPVSPAPAAGSRRPSHSERAGLPLTGAGPVCSSPVQLVLCRS